jgi:hypothetical protein
MARYRFDFLSSDGRKAAPAGSSEKSDAFSLELRGELLPKNGHGPFARPRRFARMPCLPRQEPVDMEELEFGDYGRDPRFLPGWWILPAWLLGSAFIISIVILLV